MKFGEKFKIFRNRLHLKQKDVAEKADISHQHLSKIEADEIEARPATRNKLIEALGMSVEEFDSLREGDNHDMPQPVDMVEVPLYGSIPAGPPADIQSHYGETFKILRHLAGPGRYALRVVGDSMAPGLQDRDLVLIKYVSGVNLQDVNNKICAVCLNGECTLKRIQIQDTGQVILHPDNPSYFPIPVTATDNFFIQGVMLRLVDRIYE
jgi:SOS-response transcriptional repressor LexA